MIKRTILVLISLTFFLTLSCTSKTSEDSANENITADPGLSDESGLELSDTPNEEQKAGELSEADLGAPGAAATGETTQALSDEPTQEIVPPVETKTEGIASAEPPPPTPIEEPSSSAPMEALTPDNATEVAPPVAQSEESSSDVPRASLQKMATTPWRVGKTLYNALYVARPGDSLKSISQKIYGTDKVKELKKGNPTYKSRDLKPGDKVYYNSPVRPTDEEKVLTYYEDIGATPEIYIAKKGDNIRKISKKLLGYGQAWKEIWATNIVESKGSLEEGTEIKYWKGAGSATMAAGAEGSMGAPMAQGGMDMPPSQADMNMPPPQMDMPPPPSEMVPPPQADMNMPPPQMDMPPPPPPPSEMVPPPQASMDMPPPPPMPKVEKKKPSPMGEESELLGEDNTTVLAAAMVIAIGLAGFLIMRKRRKQKEFDQGLEHTNVG